MVVAAPSMRTAAAPFHRAPHTPVATNHRRRCLPRQDWRSDGPRDPHTAGHDRAADRHADDAVQRHRGLDGVVAPAGSEWAAALSAHRAILRAAFTEHAGVEWAQRATVSSSCSAPRARRSAAAVAAQRELQRRSGPAGSRCGCGSDCTPGNRNRTMTATSARTCTVPPASRSTAHGGQIVLSAATARLARRSARGRAARPRPSPAQGLPGGEQLFDVVASGLLDSSSRRCAASGAWPPCRPGRHRSSAARTSWRHCRRCSPIRRPGWSTLTGPGGCGKTRLATAAAAAARAALSRRRLLRRPGGRPATRRRCGRRSATRWTSAARADGDVAAQVSAPSRPDGAAGARQPRADRRTPSVVGASARGRGAGRRAGLVAPAVAARRANGVPGRRRWRCRRRRARGGAALARGHDVRATGPAGPAVVPGDPGQRRGRRRSVPTPRRVTPGTGTRRGPDSGCSARRRCSAGSTAGWAPPSPPRTARAASARSHDMIALELRPARRWRAGSVPPARRVPTRRRTPRRVAGGRAVGCRRDLDVVARLVAANMVRVGETADGEPRIDMLETMRAFAAERLDEAGEGDAVRAAPPALVHRAGRSGTVPTTARQPAHRRLRSTRRASTTTSAPRSRSPSTRPARPLLPVATGRRLLITVTTQYWYLFGSVERGAALAGTRAGPVGDAGEDEADVGLLFGLGVSLLQQGLLTESLDLLGRSREMAERIGAHEWQARVLNAMAVVQRQAGEFAASMELLQRSLTLARSAGNDELAAKALGNLVVLHHDLGDYDAALRTADEALAVNAARGDDWAVAIDRVNYVAALLRTAEAAPLRSATRGGCPRYSPSARPSWSSTSSSSAERLRPTSARLRSRPGCSAPPTRVGPRPAHLARPRSRAAWLRGRNRRGQRCRRIGGRRSTTQGQPCPRPSAWRRQPRCSADRRVFVTTVRRASGRCGGGREGSRSARPRARPGFGW